MSKRLYKDDLFAIVKPGNHKHVWFWDIYDGEETDSGQRRAELDVSVRPWGSARSEERAIKKAKKQLERIREQRRRLSGARTEVR